MTSGDDKKVPLRIRLPFTTEDEFIERYGVHVSRGGIFIATRAARPEGTPLSLELVLQDGSRLMRAEGLVQKVAVDEQPGKSGMMVRFLRVDARTRALIDRIIALKEGAGAAQPPPAEDIAPAPPAPPAPPPPPAPSAPRPRGPVALADDVVLGVDLGTTTCRAAMVIDGVPKLVSIAAERGVAMPSVVALDPVRGKLLVGSAARTRRVEHPELAVSGFKRLLGRRARSRKVRDLTPRFSFQVVADPEGDAGVELGGRVYSMTELCAELLREMKSAAQEQLGRELTRAVLCVPAWYTDHQRTAVLEAGRLAGLEVLRVLNEPTAVALAFGHGRGLARKRVLVYDLGGGTFDASVVEITGDDLEVVSTGGDAFLGGLDFDDRLADALLHTMDESARDRLLGSRMAVERVRDAAELTKIALSEQQLSPVHVPFATTDEAGQPLDLRVEVERSFLEQATQDLVERTAEVTQVVLDAARLTPAHLDEVLAVGGQSRAPAVRARLELLLGRAPRSDVDPQGAVALGAALLGQALVLAERGKQGSVLREVLGAPIGLAVQGGGFRRVLERNTRLPAEKTLSIPVRSGQAVELALFQGSLPRADENEYLGALSVPADREGELAVRFSVSADGRLSLSALGPSGRQLDAVFSIAEASDELKARLLAEAPLPGDAPRPSASGLFTGLKRLFGRNQ
jgi:molecular chaperone DnaK